MLEHSIIFTDKEINVILNMISFGQLEISRQMKRLGNCDVDLKEYYWYFRSGSNEIKRKLQDLRGY